MDANTVSEIIMNDDSDMSDFNQSSEDEDVDISSDSDVDSDPPASSTTVVLPATCIEKKLCVADCR